MGATISSYFADPFDVSSPDHDSKGLGGLDQSEIEMIANKRIEYFQKQSAKPERKKENRRKEIDHDTMVRDWCN